MKKKSETYRSELIRSMEYLANDKRTIFLGQSVLYSGNAIYNTLETIPKKKKIEMPVFEDTQMGLSIGMAINGFVPISCYPRFDFLILAMNQLFNHLDKMQFMSKGQFKPRVIIRTSIGSKTPLNGGIQHTQDYTKIFKQTATELDVVLLNKKNQIFPAYKKALNRKDSLSTLLIEHGDYYNRK